jgi:heterodisulfide reductase subunit C
LPFGKQETGKWLKIEEGKVMAVQEKVVSREFKEYIRDPNPDVGLDETIKRLTPEKIEKVVKAVIGGRSSRIKAILNTCIHCGLCANACQWYLSNDKDPTYAPVAKMRMTIWEMIKRDGKVDAEFIKQCARIVFTECNICHRCSMYCPYGLDITFIIGMVRRICFLLGVMPQRQFDQAEAHIATLNQVWYSQNDWLDTIQWQEEEVGADFKDLRIPIDKEGAEAMWLPLGAEPKTGTYHIERTAKIMLVAGVNWTVPGKDTWDSSSMSMFVRDFVTMQRIVRGLYENAARLRIKKMVLTE